MCDHFTGQGRKYNNKIKKHLQLKNVFLVTVGNMICFSARIMQTYLNKSVLTYKTSTKTFAKVSNQFGLASQILAKKILMTSLKANHLKLFVLVFAYILHEPYRTKKKENCLFQEAKFPARDQINLNTNFLFSHIVNIFCAFIFEKN